MCCKVYRIPVLNKQEGKWCAHCAIGSGCRIYEDRPEQCRSFVCLWLPGTPFAWRKEPYFSRLKAMAEQLLKDRRHVLVFVNGNATLIMPTGPVPIGPMSPEDGFVVRETFTAKGKDYVAERVARAPGRPA